MTNKCIICGSENLKNFKIGKASLFQCQNCKIIVNKDLPNEKVLEEFYSKKYEISSPEIIHIEQRRFARLPEQYQLIKLITEYKKPPARILDIGCDRSFFLDSIRRFGFEVTGIELSLKARSYVENIGIKVFSKINEVNQTFDIVTFWHSLEHISQPLLLLNELKEKVNKNGLLFIRVPAFDCFWRKIFQSKWIWFQPVNHLFHFSVESLNNLLTIAGYEVIFIKKQKPNNFITLISSLLSIKVFLCNEKLKVKIRKIISILFEYLTAVEILAICKKTE